MSPLTAVRLKGLTAAVIWGASFVATKAALSEIHPVTLIVLRFALGLGVLILAVWQARTFRRITRRDLFLLAVLGTLAIAVHQGLQATGLLFTSASNMAWLVAMQPVFTAILAWLFLAEVFGIVKIAGLVIAFAGAILVVTKGVFSPDALRLPGTLGDLLALASALNWTIFSVASKPMLRRLPPSLMMAYVMGIGWLIVLPFFVAAQGWHDLSRLTPTGWGAVAFLGIFCSGIAYIFWYDALAHIDASQVAAFIYLEPFVTVVVAAIVLHEAFTPISIIGGVLILLGVALVNRAPTTRQVAGAPGASD